MRDLTPAQAERWIAQEAAKYQSRESIQRFMVSHETMKDFAIPGFLVAAKAQDDLAELLTARLGMQ